MYKFLSSLFVLCLIILTVSLPVNAASQQIKIDGVVLTSDGTIDLVNNRLVVPLRVVSENVGAKIEWIDSKVVLSKNDTRVTLRVGERTVRVNDETDVLDVKPYIKNNRVMVPIRFIAELFSCNVNYSNNIVSIETEPFFIKNTKVNVLQREYHMTMGGVVQHVKGNAYMEDVYEQFLTGRGQQVDEPTNYSWRVDIDTVGAYYKYGQFDFLDENQRNVQRFDVYGVVNAFPAELLAPYPKVLLHDVTANKWYLFTDEAIQMIEQLINTANKNGFLTVVSNTVV